MRQYSLFFITTFFITTTACVTTQLSPQQRRSMQVKHFNASYNHVFRAFKTVLQDEGYIINNQDMSGGLIVAQTSKPVGAGMTTMAILSGAKMYQTDTKYSISVNLEAIRKNYVESRIIIQQVQSYNTGSTKGQEIVNPQMYQNIYSKVFVEVERRKAQGK